MSKRLKKIDSHFMPDHYYLDREDECYYFKEYITGEINNENSVNQLIYNLKKSVLRKNKSDYFYKDQAIQRIVRVYRKVFSQSFLERGFTLIPIPPSHTKDDKEYDDRMTQILQGLIEGRKGDLRELIVLSKNIGSSHRSQNRPDPDELLSVLKLDKNLCKPEPTEILLFDDVITTGAHFVACKRILQERFPKAHIRGVFIARRRIDNTGFN